MRRCLCEGPKVCVLRNVIHVFSLKCVFLKKYICEFSNLVQIPSIYKTINFKICCWRSQTTQKDQSWKRLHKEMLQLNKKYSQRNQHLNFVTKWREKSYWTYLFSFQWKRVISHNNGRDVADEKYFFFLVCLSYFRHGPIQMLSINVEVANIMKEEVKREKGRLVVER